MDTTEVREDATTVSLALTPLPTECGVKIRRPLKDDWEKPNCVRDKGHGGRHRGWVSPPCDLCGAEMRLMGAATYTCNHPGVVDRAQVRRAVTLLRYRRAVAYALAGEPDNRQSLPIARYREATRVLTALELEGALS